MFESAIHEIQSLTRFLQLSPVVGVREENAVFGQTEERESIHRVQGEARAALSEHGAV